jgi:hypothetical protein
MFDQYLPTIASSYNWFFYLGIFLFVSHLFLYGFGLDLSYFGLLLIYIGWAKPHLYTWFRWFLWIFIFLDVYANLTAIKKRLLKSMKKKVIKKNKNKDQDQDQDQDQNKDKDKDQDN